MAYQVMAHIYKDPHTFVEIEDIATIGRRAIKIVGHGFAKRNACDKPNKNIGYEVAIARAIEDVRRKRTKIKNAIG